MKRTFTIVLLTFGVTSVSPTQSGDTASRPSPQTEREIIQTVHAVGQAWAVHDLATLDSLLGDHYIHSDAFGQFQNRAEWLDYVRSDRLPHQLRAEDIQVRIYGDVAVVTGRNLWNPGVRFVTLPLRFTQVLTREKGYWQRSAITSASKNCRAISF